MSKIFSLGQSEVQLSPGDHISEAGTKGGGFVRDGYGVYRHHMLVVASRMEEDSKTGRHILVDVLNLLVDGLVKEETKRYLPGEFRKHSYRSKYSGEKAVELGRIVMAKMANKPRYDLAAFNCEHFVRLVRTGMAKSRQVKRAIHVMGGALAGSVLGGLTGLLFGPRVGFGLFRVGMAQLGWDVKDDLKTSLPVDASGGVSGYVVGMAEFRARMFAHFVGGVVGVVGGTFVGGGTVFAVDYAAERFAEDELSILIKS